MDFSYTKDYIVKNDLLEDILERMDCGHIRSGGNYYSASLPEKFDSDTRSNIHIYKESLISRIWTRGISGDIFHVIAYVLEFETTVEALRWVNEVYSIKQNSTNYASKKNVNSWMKLLHTRRKITGKNEEIDESILLDYDFVNSMDFIRDGISESTQIEFEIGFDQETKRYTIPVRNQDGKLVGVKGRRIKEDYLGRCISVMPEAKYMYLEEMDKTIELYGLHKTRDYITESKKVYVFEAEKSVMQAWDFGVKNTVAISGSDISIEQAKTLRQLKIQGIDIIMCWDSDKHILADDKESQDFLSRQKDKIGVEFSIVESWNMEQEYSSPTDYGKEVFEEVVKNIITIENGASFKQNEEIFDRESFSFDLEDLLN